MLGTDITYNLQEKTAYVGAADNVIQCDTFPMSTRQSSSLRNHVTCYEKCLSSPLSHCCCAQHRENAIRIQILLEPLLFIEALKL